MLDRYERRWEGRLLHPRDYVISADEKSQLQALLARHQLVAPAPNRPGLREFEYTRHGTMAYRPRSTFTTPSAACSAVADQKTGIEPWSGVWSSRS